jgi:hypothetical protein
MRTKKSAAKLQAIVDDFNRSYPIGTEVLLRKNGGDLITRVWAKAIVLQGHSAVAWFEGVSGAYSIEDGRVRLASEVI